MKCKRPVQIKEHLPDEPGEIKRTVKYLYPFCRYFIATNDNCICPYDYCFMDHKLSLKEEK